MPDAPNPTGMTELQFIEQHAAKMEAAETASSAQAPESDTKPDEKKDTAPPAKTEKPTPEHGAEDHAPDTDEASGASEESAEREDESEEDDGGEEGAGDDEGASEEEDGDQPEDGPSAEFSEAAARAKLPLSLDDIPAEARPLVEKRLKDMEAGFTRTMQEATEFRKERRAFLTERAYMEQHPVDFIAELLESKPDLIEQVQQKLDQRAENETVREADDIVRGRRKDAAAATVDLTAQREQRALQIVSRAQARAKEEGIPYELGIEEAVYAALLSSHDDPFKRDVSDADIDRIVSEKAKLYRRHTGAHRREEKKKVLKAKLADKVKSTPKVKPGAGNVPALKRSSGPDTRTLEEKMTETAERIWSRAG